MNGWLHVTITVLVLLLVTNIWLVYRVLNPLHRLASQTIDVAQGNLVAFNQPCGGIQEIGILSQTMASMAGHVRRAHQESAAYRYALIDGQEAERARLAHELHDDTVQSLIAIAQSINLATGWIEKDPARAVGMLNAARTQAVESVDSLRGLIANLRPPALEELGLVPALQMLAENEQGVMLTVTTMGKERRVPEAHELTLFRSAQEAVRNAVRHGQAKHIVIEIHYQPNEIRLVTRDDGKGFNLPKRLDSLADGGHYGLLGMYERVQQLRGSVRISSQRGQGTQIDVLLPLDGRNQPNEAVHDPVCGAIIYPQQAFGSVMYENQRYYFCCPVCQGAFQSNPETYLINLS